MATLSDRLDSKRCGTFHRVCIPRADWSGRTTGDVRGRATCAIAIAEPDQDRQPHDRRSPFRRATPIALASSRAPASSSRCWAAPGVEQLTSDPGGNTGLFANIGRDQSDVAVHIALGARQVLQGASALGSIGSPSQKRLAFRSKGSIGIAVRRGAASARNPTAPLALADPGLVLVRGPDRPSLLDERKGWIMSVKLTDAQLVMMTAAAQRGDRCLVVPDSMKGAGLSKVSARFIKLGLVREIRAKAGMPVCAATTPAKVTRSN